MKNILRAVLSIGAVMLVVTAVAGAVNPDALVTVGSPVTPFSQNKQNEPALAVDANHPNVLVAGANENIDMEACNSGDDTTCPFTAGVGVSGVYFSLDSGTTWTQPTYSGWSARNCLGVVGPDPGCSPIADGDIGTLPWYFENGLVSDGDPAVAFGPRRVNGTFSWANGSRLYYANLTANFGATRSEQAFKGFEGIAVSRTDNVAAAAASVKSAWMPPVTISRQSSTTFSDKEQVWADNAATSPFFGTVYVCWASFRGQEISPNAVPAPLIVAVSHDGGDTWTQHQITAAANNGQRNPTDGCTVRTDSHGAAYVFGVGTVSAQGHQAFELMSKSTNGGANWSRPVAVAGPVTQPGVIDPNLGRPVIDGLAGARSDLAPAPSVDIANGAPTGGADRFRCHRPDRHDLRQWDARRSTRVLHRVDKSRRELVDAATDRECRRSRLLHSALDFAKRHRRVRGLQRVHHAVPADDGHAAGARRRGEARRLVREPGHPDRGVHRAAPKPAR